MGKRKKNGGIRSHLQRRSKEVNMVYGVRQWRTVFLYRIADASGVRFFHAIGYDGIR